MVRRWRSGSAGSAVGEEGIRRRTCRAQQQPSETQLPPAWMRGRDERERRCGGEPGGGAASGGVEAELGVKHSNGGAVMLRARSSEALWGERGGGRGHAGAASRARGRGCGAGHGAQREGRGQRDRARGGEEGESGWRRKTRGGEPLAAALG